MDTWGASPGKPVEQLLEAGCRVGEDFMTELATVIDEADVELQFRDVDAERRVCHGDALLIWNQMRRGSNLRMQAQLSG